MEAKELNFYKQPFTNYHGMVYDSENNFVFQFKTDFKNTQDKTIAILNDLDSAKVDHAITVNEKDNGQIDVDGFPFILIRGWGNLTGTGAHHFTPAKAAKIQDDFRDWIISKLAVTN